jgi:transposase
VARIVSDLDRRCVHEVLDGRSRGDLERYLSFLSKEQRAGVEVVTIDLHDPPPSGSRQASRCPDRRRPSHVVRGAGEVLDTVRRIRQRNDGQP